MIYLPKQVCLIIIHRNTTHILDMPCCCARYRAFSIRQTEIGHNGTNYHNLNALQNVLLYIFFQFSIEWGLFAPGYSQIHKKYEKIREK